MSEETRERLIEAALELYLEVGWQSASLVRVAERAGFTTGAIYTHFKGKNELYAAVSERELARMGQEIALRLEAVGDDRTRLAVLRQWFRERPGRAGVRLLYDLWHQAAEHPRLRKGLARGYERTTDDVARLVERYGGELARLLGVDTRLVAVLGMALMEGLLLRVFLTGRDDSVDELFRLLERLLGAATAS